MHVLVHGGAGRAPDDPAARRQVLAEAAESASVAPTPLAAARTAIQPLEADPQFNAGVGGAVQSDGEVRTDAGVMTDDGRVGAACAMAGVAHATEVAHVVATETPHVLVAGEQAVDLARASGVETDRDLLTEATRDRFAAADPPPADRTAHLPWVRDHFAGTDTVGAVATDGDRVAAATSTAGRWFALAGRVGDVPQVGAGFYAADHGAASATGEGEAIARFGLARRVVGNMARRPPQQAAEATLQAFEAETAGRAGVVVVDHSGASGAAWNTDAMQTARREE